MTGGLVLQHCISSSEIDSIIVISRRTTGVTHPKLQEVIHEDFSAFSEIASYFEKTDIAYFCLGAYTGAVSDDVFKKITVDFTIAFADALKAASPSATFCFLSGSGADPTEKSRISFARYKGMAENYLLQQFPEQTYLFRPGYIYPVTKRKEPNFGYVIGRTLYPVLKLLGKKFSIKSTELAQAMFEAGITGAPKAILENDDILALLDEQ